MRNIYIKTFKAFFHRTLRLPRNVVHWIFYDIKYNILIPIRIINISQARLLWTYTTIYASIHLSFQLTSIISCASGCESGLRNCNRECPWRINQAVKRHDGSQTASSPSAPRPRRNRGVVFLGASLVERATTSLSVPTVLGTSHACWQDLCGRPECEAFAVRMSFRGHVACTYIPPSSRLNQRRSWRGASRR